VVAPGEDAGGEAASEVALRAWDGGEVDRSWTLGIGCLDGVLPAGALDARGVHEVAPRDAGERAAALAFALRLAVRRWRGLAGEAENAAARIRPLLWCWSRREAAEQGRPYGPGLEELGLGATAGGGAVPGPGMAVVEAAGSGDVLWAMEEGLRSGSLALVVGVLDAVDTTAARRLALAAAAGATPVLVLPRWNAPATIATATRWRVGARRSGPHPFVAASPGETRLSLTLERCRHGGRGSEGMTAEVEWSDVAHRFCLASRVAVGAAAAGAARHRAG
jgi:protein ImuA